MTRCRHNRTGIFHLMLWCYDCGAIRAMEEIGDNKIGYRWSGWLYPRGSRAVLKKLGKMEGYES